MQHSKKVTNDVSAERAIPQKTRQAEIPVQLKEIEDQLCQLEKNIDDLHDNQLN